MSYVIDLDGVFLRQLLHLLEGGDDNVLPADVLDEAQEGQARDDVLIGAWIRER